MLNLMSLNCLESGGSAMDWLGGGGVEQPGAIYNGSGSLKQATDPFPLQHLAQNTTEPTSWATSKAEAK